MSDGGGVCVPCSRMGALSRRRSAGSTSSLRLITLGLLAAVHLQGARGLPRYVDESSPVDYQDESSVKKAKGTPLDGRSFELRCKVANDQPNCAVAQGTWSWGQQYLCGVRLLFPFPRVCTCVFVWACV